jgi:hypothetical protein
MAGILSLPDECLDMIFSDLRASHYYEEEPHQPLLASASTCRRFNQRANRFLYQTWRNHSIRPFLRTLCQRPDLAAYVREIEIKGWETEMSPALERQRKRKRYPETMEPIEPSKISTSDFELFVSSASFSGVIAPKAIERVDLEKHGHLLPRGKADRDDVKPEYTTDCLHCDGDWLRCIKAGIEDAEVLLLVSILPNVRSIVLDPIPAGTMHWNGMIHRSTHCFPFLEDVILESDRDAPFQSSTFSSLMRVPSLKCMDLCSAGDFQIQEKHPWYTNSRPLHDWDCPPRSSSVSGTSLFDSGISKQVMQGFILGMKSMSIFNFRTESDSGLALGQYTMKDLMQALSQHHESLERLALVTYWCRVESSWSSMHIGSLKHFKRLRSLEVDESNVILYDTESTTQLRDLLPSSIEDVMVTRLDWDEMTSESWAQRTLLTQNIERIAQTAPDCLPNLKEFRLGGATFVPRAQREQLSEAFKGIGAEFIKVERRGPFSRGVDLDDILDMNTDELGNWASGVLLDAGVSEDEGEADDQDEYQEEEEEEEHCADDEDHDAVEDGDEDEDEDDDGTGN